MNFEYTKQLTLGLRLSLQLKCRLHLGFSFGFGLEITLGLSLPIMWLAARLIRPRLSGLASRLVRVRFPRLVFRLTKTRDIHRSAAYPDLLQVHKNVLWHAGGKIDQAVALLDRYVADVFACQTRFIGDCANDVARFYVVFVSDLNSVALFVRIQLR